MNGLENHKTLIWENPIYLFINFLVAEMETFQSIENYVLVSTDTFQSAQSGVKSPVNMICKVYKVAAIYSQAACGQNRRFFQRNAMWSPTCIQRA